MSTNSMLGIFVRSGAIPAFPRTTLPTSGYR